MGQNTELPFEDRTDFEDADRGMIGALEPCVVKDADGRVVWNNDAFGFLRGEAPDTANPSLWRQSQLCARQGLYEVADGVYQVRGLDLSNMTLVEGRRGVIVIDPLVSTETAAAALSLYRRHRGGRPVTGVIYTHSHIDHFGGVEGVVSEEVPILAPEGFLEHAVAENVYAGTAMLRRGVYHTGASLEPSPTGLIGDRAGADRLDRHGVAAAADGGHHPHGAGGDARRRADRLPVDPGHRGAVGDELPVPRAPRPVHGRERHPQPAQHPHPAGRGGARRAHLVALP
jgi:alkyl sulfatase BDS1-like metallo-beta-lactamase superfamily hydrolase